MGRSRPITEAELRRAESATWGDLPDLEPPPPTEPKRMRLISWKSVRKNSLLGFASVELPIGLKISDVPVLASHNKIWASLPSKPQLDRDGQHKRDINGKLAYTAILEWTDRARSDRFSEAVVALVRAEYPDLDGAP